MYEIYFSADNVFLHGENRAIKSDIMLNKDAKIDIIDTFSDISDEEIINLFSSLEEGKASRPGEISVSILKKLPKLTTASNQINL